MCSAYAFSERGDTHPAFNPDRQPPWAAHHVSGLPTTMTRYKHTQIGYVTGGAGLIGTLFTYYAFTAEYGTLGWPGFIMTGALGLVTILFSTLTVEIDDQELRFYFGPGFWRKRIPLRDIKHVEVVRNTVYYGWGIRYTFDGWLYNVSGLDAVELYAEGMGTLRIGTDEPHELKRALEQARQAA